MTIPRVIIEITPSRIEVAMVRSGTVGEWRRERFARADWPSPYTTVLPEAAATVGRLLADIGAANAEAAIVYSAPGSVTGLTSCATSISAGGAEQAAMLALTNLADFPIEEAPSDSCQLSLDTPVRSKGATAPQRHVLACADSEERAAALCEAITGTGVRVAGLIPAEAVATADAVRAAVSCPTPDQITAVVWVGEHSTSLAAAGDGRLLFVRTIAAGTEALAEALRRPLRPREPEGAPITLDHDAARALLLGVGVPAPDAPVAGYPTLAGSSLLPHLQPILQRLSIEIKQSLRFGVPESDRSRVRLRLAGPGAAVPGLGDALARVSGFPVDPSEIHTEPPDAQDSSSGGLIAAMARCPHLEIRMLPAATRATRRRAAARRAMLIGASIALAYVGYEAFDAMSTLRSERQRYTTLSSSAQSAQGPMAVRQMAMSSRAALTDAERRLRKAMDQSPDWAALMEVVSQTTPKQIRVATMDMVRDASRCSVELRGHIRFGEVADPAALIHEYIEKLGALPVVESVRLGATSRAAVAGHDSQTFTMTLSVVALPPAGAPGPRAASAASEGR